MNKKSSGSAVVNVEPKVVEMEEKEHVPDGDGSAEHESDEESVNSDDDQIGKSH